MPSTPIFTLSTAPVNGTWPSTQSVGFVLAALSNCTLTALGIFDSAGDGIGAERVVRLYEENPAATWTVIASATFNGDGTLEGAFRFKDITPVSLLSTRGYVVAVSSSASPTPAWQTGDGGTWSENSSGGRVFTGLALSGTVNVRPTSTLTKLSVVLANAKIRDEGADLPLSMGLTATLSGASPMAASAALEMGLSATLGAVAGLEASAAMVVGLDATLVNLNNPGATFAMSTSVAALLRGVIEGGGITLQAQRTAWEVEPGYLPGSAGFDGTAGAPFGESVDELHTDTPIVFVGLFRGAVAGQVVGETRALPVEEVSETDAFDATTLYSPVRPNGSFEPGVSSFAKTTQPLQGPASNLGLGEGYGLVRTITSQIRNDGGTEPTEEIAPRHREVLYARLWTDAPPEGTLLAMATSETDRAFRAWRNPSDALVLESWTGLEWYPVVTSLTITGNGAMVFDTVRSERLWLVLETSGGAVQKRYTQDEGRSFSVATTVTSSGTHPDTCASPTGVLYVFWIDGDTIKRKSYDAEGNVLQDAASVVASNVQESPIACTYSREKIFLTYRNDSDQVVTKISSDGGKTFT